jgi:hypothetical protein
MPYTEVTISSYNANPPTDDGSSDASNTITWSGIKTKLGNPLNTAIPSVDDNVATACGTIDTAITAAELSIASSVTLINASSGAATAPAGTQMFYVQTSAPTGWTKITTFNDYALRLIAGTVSTGGSTAFTSVFTSRTITSSLMPSHSHSFTEDGSLSFSRSTFSSSVDSDGTGGRATGGNQDNMLTNVDSSTGTISGTISFSGTSGSAGSGTAMDFAVQYVDVILASKN